MDSQQENQPYRPQKFTLPGNNTFDGTAHTPAYVFSEDIIIAVDVALATGRPLLVSGLPGTGKTTLAKALASLQGWRYIEHTFTSRSRLDELTGELDQLKRLNDAQLSAASRNRLLPDWAYFNPGILWWAFNPDSAKNRGSSEADREKLRDDNLVFVPALYTGESGEKTKDGDEETNVVILLDEIDKADPDLPNDLLQPLDFGTFGLSDGRSIHTKDGIQTLTLITTNGERQLAPAFLRRCIKLHLDLPLKADLVKIANHHFDEHELHGKIAQRFITLRDEQEKNGERLSGTSEYLDTVKAMRELDLEDTQKNWETISKVTLLKDGNA